MTLGTSLKTETLLKRTTSRCPDCHGACPAEVRRVATGDGTLVTGRPARRLAPPAFQTGPAARGLSSPIVSSLFQLGCALVAGLRCARCLVFLNVGPLCTVLWTGQ